MFVIFIVGTSIILPTLRWDYLHTLDKNVTYVLWPCPNAKQHTYVIFDGCVPKLLFQCN